MKKVVFGLVSTLLLASMLILAFAIQPVKASGTIYIRADGSIDPPTAPIQRVEDIYTFTDSIYDSIVVERNNIVVDGNGYTLQGTGSGMGIGLSGRTNVTVQNTQIKNFYCGIYLSSSSYNSISGNDITANNYYGILLSSSSYNSISGNNIANNYMGIRLYYPSNNSISDNNITNNYYGISFYSSSNSSISGNDITANNGYGIGLYYSSNNNSISGNTFTNDGLLVDNSYQNSVENNTVNDRPLVYLEEVSNYTVDDAGQVILVRCDNIRVEGLNLSRTIVGVQLWETNNSTISGDNIANNYYGIGLYYSSNNNSISGNNITANNCYGIGLNYSSYNSISGNNITANNGYGIGLGCSSDNSIYHNNFTNNTYQVYTFDSVNVWDDCYPSGGNYWSDYENVDLYSGPYQNRTGSDGIWDHPYVIDGNNRDNYPLVNPWTPHINAIINIIPKTLNLRSKAGYVTAFIEVTQSYNVSNIDVFSILLNNAVQVDLSAPIAIGDYDSDGIPDLMVKFDRTEVIDYILDNVNIEERFVTITLTITGKLNDGTPFKGSDTIKIVMPRNRPIPI